MEEKIFDKIKKEAEDIPVPESLSPENMKKKLEATETKKVRHFGKRRWVALAASVAVVLGVGFGYGSIELHRDNKVEDVASTGITASQETDAGLDQYNIPGVMHSAKNYQDVSDLIEDARVRLEREQKISNAKNFLSGGTTFSKNDAEYAMEEAADGDSADLGVATEAAAGGAVEHSDTNLRTTDVDEGDIVKTDGKYIYQYLSSGKVRITAINNGKMDEVSTFEPDTDGDSYICEMYVRDDSMVLLVEAYETSLEQDTADDRGYYFVNDKRSIHALTYDISDRSSPKKIGEVTIDGDYRTSRISDGYLYVMSTYGQPILYYCGLDYGYVANDGGVEGYAKETEDVEDVEDTDETGASDEPEDEKDGEVPEDLKEVIPKINDEYVAAENIILPEKSRDEPFYVITSIKLSEPSEYVDTKAVMGYVDQVYASSDSLFFYGVDYYENDERTEIVKLSYEDGRIIPKAAGAVPGYIDDSFCIDEDSKGNLRVATTTWKDNGQESSLYILDSDMKKVGSLVDIAKNEGIKSCRFMGDTGYIVTFRNTDPLFTIDLSDPANPQIISELTIPGFSEYLHYWGDGLLLGVGYDADIDTGGTTGVKLSMFDVSDPANTKEVAKLILDVDSADLLYGNYKSVLIDPEKNLFGFSCSDWGEEEDNWEEKGYYMVFSYKDGEFSELLTSKLDMDDGYWDMARGIYAGDYFYLIHDEKIRSYSMEDYKKVADYE